MDVALSLFLLKKCPLGEGKRPPKLHNRGWIWTMIFYDLKKFPSNLSNEGSNLTLSSLEVGH